MQWSQLKKQIESRLAPSLQRRLHFYNAVYRASHDHDGARGWITLDGHQIFNAATYSAWNAEHRGSDPRIQHLRPELDSALSTEWATPEAEARRLAVAGKQDGLYTQLEFNEALAIYVQLSLDDALASPLVLHRALAFLDRRLGRRRYIRAIANPSTYIFEQACRELRAEVEGWPSPRELADPSLPTA